LWDAKPIQTSHSFGLELHRLSTHLEEGFPGNLNVVVRYELDNQNALSIFYQATTDHATVINLTNHSYFNLKGHGDGNILEHDLMIHSDRITSVGEGLIPDGTYTFVADTPLDFSTPIAIGARINDAHPLLEQGNGYDHNYVLGLEGKLDLAATVFEPVSGRIMEVFTKEPGVQLYTSNWLDGSLIGKEGIAYEKNSAICLETQHFPDSPNHANFPSTQLSPGEVYQSQTVYKFSVKD